MGSTNSGNFSDYPGTSSKDGQSGGASGQDKCSLAFSARLEDVERCEYYQKYNQLPAVGTNVYVSLGKRLEVVNESNETIGYLPTKFNYLAGCMNDNYKYKGVITIARSTPIIAVEVDIAPY